MHSVQRATSARFDRVRTLYGVTGGKVVHCLDAFKSIGRTVCTDDSLMDAIIIHRTYGAVNVVVFFSLSLCFMAQFHLSRSWLCKVKPILNWVCGQHRNTPENLLLFLCDCGWFPQFSVINSFQLILRFHTQ